MQARLPGLVDLDAGNPGPLTGTGNHLAAHRAGADAHRCGRRDAHAPGRDRGGSGAAGQTLRQVVVTHAHSDHASGAPAISARWPAAIFSKWPWPAADTRYAVEWTPLADRQVMTAGDVSLEVMHTPGHAPDHICLWHSASHTLFGGDLLIEGSTVVVPGSRGGDLIAYLDSLDRVAALEPSQVLPAHGRVIDDPSG